jgi:hypothetical protein
VLVPDGKNIVEQWKKFKRRQGNGGSIEFIGLESEIVKENRSDPRKERPRNESKVL